MNSRLGEATDKYDADSVVQIVRAAMEKIVQQGYQSVTDSKFNISGRIEFPGTPIDQKYAALIQSNPWIGQPSSLGLCPDGAGRYRHYDGGASIYWHPQTGAHLIYGLIRHKYAALGWERSPVGYPTTDEADAGSGQGRYNNFPNGSIIWKRGATEAFVVYGAIYQKWGEHNWDSGFLGFRKLTRRGLRTKLDGLTVLKGAPFIGRQKREHTLCSGGSGKRGQSKAGKEEDWDILSLMSW